MVNIAVAWAISKANRTSLNVEGAFQHILTDLYGFIATAIAGLIVLTTGFDPADAIATLVVVVLMVKAGAGLVRESGGSSLKRPPPGPTRDLIGDKIVALAGVDEVHDLHIWAITSGQTALSAHVLVEPGRDCHGLRRQIEQLLGHDHGISHTTFQVDHSPPAAAFGMVAAEGPMLPLVDEHCDDAHGPVHRDEPHPH